MTRGMKTSEFLLVVLAWVVSIVMLVAGDFGAVSGQAAAFARQFGGDGTTIMPVVWLVARTLFKAVEAKYMAQAPALPSVIPAPPADPVSALPVNQ